MADSDREPSTTPGLDLAGWRVVGVFALCSAAYLGFTPTGGWDIWWHMAIGKVAVEQWTTLPVDIFSHSVNGEPWLYKDLLAGIIFYEGFRAMGFAWFAILKGLPVLSIMLGALLITPADRRDPLIVLIAGGLAVAAVQYRIVERPLLFSMMLYPVLVVFLERAARKMISSRSAGQMVRPILSAVFTIWIWALLHRAVLVGLGVFAVHATLMWVAALRGRVSRRTAAIFTLGLMAAALLVLCNPCGVHLYTTGLSMAKSEIMREMISDWARVGPITLLIEFPVTVALFVAGAAAWIARRLRGGGDSTTGVAHGVLMLLFACFTLADSIRWIPYLSIQSALVLVMALSSGKATVFSGSVMFRRARAGMLLVAMIGMCGLIMLQNQHGVGVGEMHDRYPEGAVEFAREHRLGGKVANVFHLGGYLIWKMWPQVLVTIDGRNDIIYSPEYLENVLRSQNNADVFREMQATDGVEWVMASNIPGYWSHGFLTRDDGWMLVYWSEPALIFVTRKDHPELAVFELSYIDPVAVDVSVVSAVTANARDPAALAHLESQIMRMIKASPQSIRANTAGAIYFHFRGPAYREQRNELLRMVDLLDTEGSWSENLRSRFNAIGEGGNETP